MQHDMGSMNVSQCCALCKADVRCGIWVITPPGKCWIKSSYGIPTPAPGIISMCTVPGDPAVCPVPPPPPPPQHYICAGSQCVKGKTNSIFNYLFQFVDVGTCPILPSFDSLHSVTHTWLSHIMTNTCQSLRQAVCIAHYYSNRHRILISHNTDSFTVGKCDGSLCELVRVSTCSTHVWFFGTFRNGARELSGSELPRAVSKHNSGTLKERYN